MKPLTVISFLTILFLSSGFSEQGIWIIDSESRLIIHGSTNVNTFKCMFDCLETIDTLEYFPDGKVAEIRFSKNRMTIPIRNFNCGNKQITKDFWTTLKSDKYPHLDIYFRALKTATLKNNVYVDGIMDITLAGTTKRYVVRYHTTIPKQGVLLLNGSQEVNFSDFNLEPPQKLMGLIQVQECLNVEFNLTLKSI